MLNLPSEAHASSLTYNSPPPNPVLSFLFKVGMVVYEVAAKKNMIFKIRTCWSWWYQLGEAIYKWRKDDALFKTFDLFVSWLLFVRSRERQTCCHVRQPWLWTKRYQSRVTLGLCCRACKEHVVLRLWRFNRGDPLPPPEWCCEKQVKLVRWEAGPNIWLEGKRTHSKKRRLGDPKSHAQVWL